MDKQTKKLIAQQQANRFLLQTLYRVAVGLLPDVRASILADLRDRSGRLVTMGGTDNAQNLATRSEIAQMIHAEIEEFVDVLDRPAASN